MDSRKIVFKETAIVAVGEVLGIGVMLGIYALLHRFSGRVAYSAALGGVLALLNFFLMAVGTSLAADKAEAQNVKRSVKGGQAAIQTSYLLRLVGLVVILFACAKSGYFELLPLLLPLLFVRPALTLGEFFRKKEEKTP